MCTTFDTASETRVYGVDMTTSEFAEVRAPNSLLLVMDLDSREIPESFGGNLIAASGCCVAVGTLSEADGMTRVEMVSGREAPQVGGDWLLAWEGDLSTPSGSLVVATAHDAVLLRREVGGTAHIRLLVNDASEPDRIVVAVG
jgi:hypothetical protein